MKQAALCVAVLLAAGPAGAHEDLRWLLTYWQACLEEKVWAVMETSMTDDKAAAEALLLCRHARLAIENEVRATRRVQRASEDVVGAELARLDDNVHYWLVRWVQQMRTRFNIGGRFR